MICKHSTSVCCSIILAGKRKCHALEQAFSSCRCHCHGSSRSAGTVYPVKTSLTRVQAALFCFALIAALSSSLLLAAIDRPTDRLLLLASFLLAIATIELVVLLLVMAVVVAAAVVVLVAVIVCGNEHTAQHKAIFKLERFCTSPTQSALGNSFCSLCLRLPCQRRRHRRCCCCCYSQLLSR